MKRYMISIVFGASPNAGTRKKNTAASPTLIICVERMLADNLLLKMRVCFPYNPARKKMMSQRTKRKENGVRCLMKKSQLGNSRYRSVSVAQSANVNTATSPKRSRTYSRLGTKVMYCIMTLKLLYAQESYFS